MYEKLRVVKSMGPSFDSSFAKEAIRTAKMVQYIHQSATLDIK